MRLTLKATGITIRPDTRDYLDKRLASLGKLIDWNDESVMVAAELGRTTRHHQSGDVFYAELTVYRGKESFRAVADAQTVTAAIDAMRDELARELASQKGRRLSLVRRSGTFAKELLRSGYDGFGEYVGSPVRAGWRRMRRMWRKDQ